MRTVFACIIITSIASLALTIWQYSQISGFDAFIKSSMEKYLYRSGFTQYTDNDLNYWNLKSWKNIVFHYRDSYLPFLIVMYTVTFMYLAALKKHLTKDILRKNKIEVTALYLCIVPVIMHHLLFFNFTSEHDFSVLKTGVFISVLTALFYYRLVNTFHIDSSDENRMLKIKIVNLIIILMSIFSIFWYQVANRGVNVEFYKNIGEEIASTANDDEVVFIKANGINFLQESGEFYVFPQIVFYAHRNIVLWESDSKAKELLHLNDVERGVIFILNKENSQISREYINK